MKKGNSMSKEEIGCCGAYCRTCQALKDTACRGCKLGYKNSERDMAKAKCKIKICCMNNGFVSCADCSKYNTCETIQNLHNKNGYKYRKYRQAIIFIRDNGYEQFLAIADKWSMPFGKYK